MLYGEYILKSSIFAFEFYLQVQYYMVLYRIDLHYRIDLQKMQKMANCKKLLSLNGYLLLIKIQYHIVTLQDYNLQRNF